MIVLRSALVALTLALPALANAETAPAAETKPAAPAAEKSEKVEKVTFTNKLIDGKKTWIPGDAKVHAGSKLEITLVNTLKEPHGFSAPGMTDEIVVGGGETKTIVTDVAKAGDYKFHCQLHPAHVGGKITVQ